MFTVFSSTALTGPSLPCKVVNGDDATLIFLPQRNSCYLPHFPIKLLYHFILISNPPPAALGIQLPLTHTTSYLELWILPDHHYSGSSVLESTSSNVLGLPFFQLLCITSKHHWIFCESGRGRLRSFNRSCLLHLATHTIPVFSRMKSDRFPAGEKEFRLK